MTTKNQRLVVITCSCITTKMRLLVLLELLLLLVWWNESPVFVRAFSIVRMTTSSSQATTSQPSTIIVKGGGGGGEFVSNCPAISPATGLPNHFYTWKYNQQIRYQQTTSNKKKKRPNADDVTTTTTTISSNKSNTKAIVVVHGLFVNSDHWRKLLTEFSTDDNDDEITIYALDLLGYGYSDRPGAGSAIGNLINGENGRFLDNGGTVPSIVSNIELGTANGKNTRIANVNLRHPISNSPYNFYTWSELLCDFVNDVVQSDSTTIVCNSIGTISSLQAVIDRPDLFNGVFVICPNFRELHSAEVPLPVITMPLVQQIQKLLRTNGQGLFETLAIPSTVKQILYEPYNVKSAVDDTLVQVLLDPLLLPGASTVVFDTLSYSAGPLPEQQLAVLSSSCSEEAATTAAIVASVKKPVWVCYGTADPWTPAGRVEALQRFSVVERVIALPNIGHCPHDEAPELIHPLLNEFLHRIYTKDE